MRQEVQQDSGLSGQLAQLDSITATNRTTDAAVGAAKSYVRRLSSDEQKYSDRAVVVAETVKEVLPLATLKLGEDSPLTLGEEAQEQLKSIVFKQVSDDLKAMYRNSHELSSNNARYYATHSNYMSAIKNSAQNVLGALALVDKVDERATQIATKLEDAKDLLRKTVEELNEEIPRQAEIDDEEWQTLQFERA